MLLAVENNSSDYRKVYHKPHEVGDNDWLFLVDDTVGNPEKIEKPPQCPSEEGESCNIFMDENINELRNCCDGS